VNKKSPTENKGAEFQILLKVLCFLLSNKPFRDYLAIKFGFQSYFLHVLWLFHILLFLLVQ
jgi:hypothetical protein